MLGEEMSVQEQTRLWNEHSDGLWIVDPIDGTNNFVNGLPHFAVSVALVKNGHAELGVIYNPVSGECFYAERGKAHFSTARRCRCVPKIKNSTNPLPA